MTQQRFQDWISNTCPQWQGSVTFLPEVLEKDAFQPEKITPIYQYLDRAVTAERVSTGIHMLGQYSADLAVISERFGVAPQYLMAIWGLETNFGQVMGDFHAPSALATLAFGSQTHARRAMFERQIGAVDDIIACGGISFSDMYSSWAGAMGHTQFMPATYLEHAVSFDGAGAPDIWGSSPLDALCSTANYLSKSGWRATPHPIEIIEIDTHIDYSLFDMNQQRSPLDWAACGISFPTDRDGLYWGYAPLGQYGPVVFFGPETAALWEYNRSPFYMLAVILLADHISGINRYSLTWSDRPAPLTVVETQFIQTCLTQQGYDTHGADGIWGRNSRAALQKWQADQEMIADGFPTHSVLERFKSV